MKLHILIVEDEAQMVAILRRFLEPLASHIEETEHLSTALEMARAQRYDVVILDLRLRFTGKMEALQAVRQFKGYKASVVVVSGLPDPDLQSEVMNAGADAFVPKDADFGRRAMLIAVQVALQQNAGYAVHVELLQRLVTEPTKTDT